MINHAKYIIENSLKEINPRMAMSKIINEISLDRDIYVLALGKAAWEMANILNSEIGNHIASGLIITKHDHSFGPISKFKIIEAGHPILDEYSIIAGNEAIKFVSKLNSDDLLITLISGGGSSLMEKPLDKITLDEFREASSKILNSGADILEFNTIRKHISAVKGGRLASLANGAKILNIIISDVIGDKLDFIASGPTVLDTSTTQESIKIIEKYKIDLPNSIMNALKVETPKHIPTCKSIIISNVEQLANITKLKAEKLGYNAHILSTSLNCEAREAGKFIASIAKYKHSNCNNPIALIFAGETVVEVKGDGIGGRNQEIALSAAIELKGEKDILLFSLGSDGTDGPTDAAGAIITGNTFEELQNKGVDPVTYLKENNSYVALDKIGALIKTGPTGTNVNDVTVVLINKNKNDFF